MTLELKRIVWVSGSIYVTERDRHVAKLARPRETALCLQSRWLRSEGWRLRTAPTAMSKLRMEYIMADQYGLKANVGRLELDLIDMPCQTEREALAKAGKIFDQFEGNAKIEILLNDVRPSLWGVTRLEEWNREGRPLPPTDAR